MRIMAAVCAGLFLVAALLQYNDPDPLRWMVLYGIAAWGAWSDWRGAPRRLWAAGLLGACVAWMSFLWHSIVAFFIRNDWSLLFATMQAGEPLIEDSREFLGLALVAAWCAWQLLRSPRVPAAR
jgi:hypothetical protein